jgi:Sulfotransferase family
MKRPVFIVGCPRSGTTLLYSLLVASGGFAFYRKETYVYVLDAKFPHLTTPRARQRFVDAYLAGYLGHVPGLDVEPLVRNASAASRRPADFLPRLMNAITRIQKMDRWIEATPAHVLYMREIRRAVPDALFVHVIRDGRDCALSMEKQRWLAALPWDRSAAVAALYWEWMVRAGRRAGRHCPADYLEVRFEQLVSDPRATLATIGAFIDHELDYDRILQNPVHSMHRPNTSFREEQTGPLFNPVGRCHSPAREAEVRSCESVVGPFLEELGYRRAYPDARGSRVRAQVTRSTYLQYFRLKHTFKTHAPLARFFIDARVWAQQPKAGERPVRPIPHVSTREIPGGTGQAVAS